MDDIEDIEIWRLGVERMLGGCTRDRKRHAYLLAAAALREAGDDEMADQVEETGLNCKPSPIAATKPRKTMWNTM